jgi:hypothetical protein
MRSEIQEAVLHGIIDEFKSEPKYRFETPNNPIEMLVDGQFRCEIRVNIQNNQIEVWTPTVSGPLVLRGGRERPSCYPLKMIPLESPSCFDDLFPLLRSL